MKTIKNIVSPAMVGLAALTLALTSCGEKKAEKVSSTLKFSKDASSLTWESNGCEEATVAKTTDGDTSNFTLKSGQTLTVRYLAVDTPESTAGYDKWGKAASKWNASILTTPGIKIILESEKNKPELDTNGSRYLAYVWYKTPEMTDYVNLNLLTVEEGYSMSNAAAGSKYVDTFKKAENYAKENKLKLHGNDEDIYFPSTIQNVTIKELKANPSKYYDAKTEVPTCVAFDAYVVSRSTSGNFLTVVVGQVNEETGAVDTYNVDIGYNSSTMYSLAIQEGVLIHFVGYTQAGNSLHGLNQALTVIREPKDSYAIRTGYIKQILRFVPTEATVENGVCTLVGSGYYDGTKQKNVKITIKDSSITQGLADTYVNKTYSVEAYNFNSQKEFELTIFSKTKLVVVE